jgi:16S rRNA (cytidine1402-2'-O)-methyltransferase
VAGAAEAPEEVPLEPPEEEIRRRLAAGEAPTEVARAIARGRKVSRSEAYALVERVRGRR